MFFQITKEQGNFSNFSHQPCFIFCNFYVIQDGNGPIDLQQSEGPWQIGLCFFMTSISLVLSKRKKIPLPEAGFKPWTSEPMSDALTNMPLRHRSIGGYRSVLFLAVLASKQPPRLRLTSDLTSVTSITHVAMLLWPLNASMRWLQQEGDQLWSIDLLASPQVKTTKTWNRNRIAWWRNHIRRV